MNVLAPNKQSAPAAETVRHPRVGDDVYFYDTERPKNEFGGIGQGPFSARVVQVVVGDIDRKPTLVCHLFVFMPGSNTGLVLAKIGHKSTIEETRAHRYWEWPSHR